MREALSYDKLAGGVPRIMILESQYWVDAACVNAAAAMGWEVTTAPVAMEGVLQRGQLAGLLDTLTAFRPDFILTVNLSGMDVDGIFARLFEDLHMPYVTWFVDDPRTIIMGRATYASPYAVALTWERAYTRYLSDAGFPAVHHLPLAVDPSVFNAEPADSWDIASAFVGNSMIYFAEREWAWVDERPALAAAMRRAFDAGRVTRENFAAGLQALLDKDVLEILDADERRHAELLFFVEGTRRLRHELAATLEPEGLELRGDAEWARVFERTGGGVNYLEDLPGFYRTCEVNVNSTSIQMAAAVNQRVFDCPAAGGFLLTDAQAGLHELFEVDTEVAVYRSPVECAGLLRWYRSHPESRREIATRARRRVLGEHTYAHRLREIVRVVKERFGR